MNFQNGSMLTCWYFLMPTRPVVFQILYPQKAVPNSLDLTFLWGYRLEKQPIYPNPTAVWEVRFLVVVQKKMSQLMHRKKGS